MGKNIQWVQAVGLFGAVTTTQFEDKNDLTCVVQYQADYSSIRWWKYNTSLGELNKFNPFFPAEISMEIFGTRIYQWIHIIIMSSSFHFTKIYFWFYKLKFIVLWKILYSYKNLFFRNQKYHVFWKPILIACWVWQPHDCFPLLYVCTVDLVCMMITNIITFNDSHVHNECVMR